MFDDSQSAAIETIARQLVARLERLSADSHWARRASGLRGSLLTCLEELDSIADPLHRQGELQHLSGLIERGFWLIAQAAREIRSPDDILHR